MKFIFFILACNLYGADFQRVEVPDSIRSFLLICKAMLKVPDDCRDIVLSFLPFDQCPFVENGGFFDICADYWIVYNIILFFTTFITKENKVGGIKYEGGLKQYYYNKSLDKQAKYCYFQNISKFILFKNVMCEGKQGKTSKNYCLFLSFDEADELSSSVVLSYIQEKFGIIDKENLNSSKKINEILSSSKFFMNNHGMFNQIAAKLELFFEVKYLFLYVISRYSFLVDWRIHGFFPSLLSEIGFNEFLEDEFESILEKGSEKHIYLKKIYTKFVSLFNMDAENLDMFNLFILVCYFLFKQGPSLTEGLINNAKNKSS